MVALRSSSQRIEITPSGQALGADVVGVDLANTLSDDDVTVIKQAWADHLVLRFREQKTLSPENLIDFSRHFGELDQAPIASTEIAGDFIRQHPEITVISNILVSDKPIGGLGASEAVWHTDMSYNERPPKGACLYAVEIPPAGGDTEFLNMYLAYDTLPEKLKERARTLHCVHDASRNSAGELRQGYADAMDVSETVGAIHPIVKEHPVTRKPSLFLGRRRNAYLVGLPLDESEALLDELWRHAVNRDFVWTQVWRLGDVVMWDNRCTMHRRDGFDPNARRLMYRTQISGESGVPVAA